MKKIFVLGLTITAFTVVNAQQKPQVAQPTIADDGLNNKIAEMPTKPGSRVVTPDMPTPVPVMDGRKLAVANVQEPITPAQSQNVQSKMIDAEAKKLQIVEREQPKPLTAEQQATMNGTLKRPALQAQAPMVQDASKPLPIKAEPKIAVAPIND